MKELKIIWLNLILMSLLIGVRSFGQDFHLSQYDAAPLYLNPAQTGLFNGTYRVCANYRTQWAAIATKPFTTAAISYDQSFQKLSAGMQILNYRAGAGDFNAFNALASLAYDLKLGPKKFHHVTLGLQGGMIQKGVNMGKLYFDEQYSNRNGGGFDNTIGHTEVFANTNVFLPDVNAGIIYYYSNDEARINPFIGSSVFHITEPTETFFSSTNKLPRRYVYHSGVKINASSKFQLLVKNIYMRQTNDQELTLSIIGNYYLDGSDTYLIFGPTYRNKDAAIIETGLKLGQFIYRVSYDINTSSLKPHTRGRGGLEFSVNFIGKKPAPAAVNSCPRI